MPSLTQESEVEFHVWGKHTIEEALRSNLSRVHEIWTAGDSIATKAKLHKVPQAHIDRLLGITKHQGMAARLSLKLWPTLKSWIETLKQSSEPSFKVLALDQVEDPQNLGAIYRSAHFFKFHAVLTPKDHSAPINGHVGKASAGALFSIPTIRCANLARELAYAAEAGFWRVGLDSSAGKALKGFSMRSSVILVMGSESKGLRRLTKESCDEILTIFPNGGRDSLNVSCAASIALYELTKSLIIT